MCVYVCTTPIRDTTDGPVSLLSLFQVTYFLRDSPHLSSWVCHVLGDSGPKSLYTWLTRVSFCSSVPTYESFTVLNSGAPWLHTVGHKFRCESHERRYVQSSFQEARVYGSLKFTVKKPLSFWLHWIIIVSLYFQKIKSPPFW